MRVEVAQDFRRDRFLRGERPARHEADHEKRGRNNNQKRRDGLKKKTVGDEAEHDRRRTNRVDRETMASARAAKRRQGARPFGKLKEPLKNSALSKTKPFILNSAVGIEPQ